MSSSVIEDNRSAVAKQWDAFKGFAYNKQEGTVMGRTGNSWGKILLFYLFYYGFLACLFAASISIVLSTLDEYTPKYQTRLQTPGIAIQPKLASNVRQTSDIIYRMGKNTDEDYDLLMTQMEEFLYAYAPVNQTAEKGFHNCTDDRPPTINQDYPADDQVLGCTFYKDRLSPCATKPYGYLDGKPCIFVKVNRIINWFPVGYTDLSIAVGNDDSDAPALATVLAKYDQPYIPYLLYTLCYGATEKDDKNLNGGEMTNTKYYPKTMGAPFAYYPYLGKKRQPGYVNPLVAVQFTNVTKNVEIDVKCKAYALNIRDSKEMAEGYFQFKMHIKNEE